MPSTSEKWFHHGAMWGGRLPWDFGVILLVLGVAAPWRGAVRIRQLLARPQLRTGDRLTIYASTIGLQWLAAAVVGWRCYARGLTAQDLGLSFAELPLTIATGLGLSLLLGGGVYYNLRRLARVPADHEGIMHQIARKLMPQNLVEALTFVGLAVTVALCEEFLYRGFALAALEHAAGGSPIFAALASSAMFALAHLYQGRPGLRATFVVALVFAAARIWTQSLAPAIGAHMVTDLVAGLAAPRVLALPKSVGQAGPARSDAALEGQKNRGAPAIII